MRSRALAAAALGLSLAACDPPPAASEPFSDAAVAAFVAFDDDDPDTLARASAQLDEEVLAAVDPEAALFGDRALAPHGLTEADVAGVEHPDRDPALTLPVAVAWRSPFAITEHDPIVLVADQSDIEPFSQSYTRTFLAGEDCYPNDCAFVRSSNAVVKENPAMTVPFTLWKDWRAFDLDDGRAARASRGWMKEGATSLEDADRIEQSYAIELWIAEDGGTTLRVLVLWAETTFAAPTGDDEVVLTTEYGMDRLFQSHDAWIAANE
jgi:hypothetical protein